MSIVIKTYICYDCDKEFEVAIDHSKQKKKCVMCKGYNIEGMIHAPMIAKVGGPRTMGSLIEQNNRKNPLTREKQLGKSENDSLTKEQAKVTNINKMSDAAKKRYIEEGKM